MEDDAQDAAAAISTLRKIGLSGVRIIADGVRTLEFLEQVRSGEQPLPDALILDLNLPLESGFSALRLCHAEPKLRDIPIVVWSKEADKLYHQICSMLGVAAYVVKAQDLTQLELALREVTGVT